jgi:hypothetical protein
MRKDAAVGVDGMDKAAYGEELQERLQDLHARLVSKRYRHQPIRRVHIPKAQGKTRPIGISAVEDKLVQDAVREVLEAVYEQDFLSCSYGFRPGRSAHDAVRRFDHIVHCSSMATCRSGPCTAAPSSASSRIVRTSACQQRAEEARKAVVRRAAAISARGRRRIQLRGLVRSSVLDPLQKPRECERALVPEPAS